MARYYNSLITSFDCQCHVDFGDISLDFVLVGRNNYFGSCWNTQGVIVVVVPGTTNSEASVFRGNKVNQHSFTTDVGCIIVSPKEDCGRPDRVSPSIRRRPTLAPLGGFPLGAGKATQSCLNAAPFCRPSRNFPNNFRHTHYSSRLYS